jgi:hypothetical protein
MTRSFWAPAVVAVVAGLLLLLSSAAGWVDGVDARDVGGVVVREPTSTSGTQFAPSGVVVGLVALLAGVALGFLRNTARRVGGAVVALTGILAIVVIVGGLVRASDAEGTMTPAPFLALVCAVAIIAAGLIALRGPGRPPAASRYRVEGERPEDDEWSLAAGDEPAD